MPMILITILPWAVVAGLCWVGYQLIQQKGRMLLRADALKQRLANLAVPSATPKQSVPTGLPIGSRASEFELPDLSGKGTKLSDFLGKRVLLSRFCQRKGITIFNSARRKAELGGK